MVVLKNGNEITGEIKRMDRGRLTFSTDDMKMVYIDWTNIVRISSKDTLDILLKSDERYQGSLQDPGLDGKVAIVTGTESITVDIQSIVLIALLRTRIWQRFLGFFSLGYELQKANTQQTFTTRSSITYRDRRWELQLQGDSYINTRDDADKISRNSVVLGYERYTRRVWSFVGYVKLAQNDELELDLRTSLGAGVGRYFVKNNLLEFTGVALLSVINEKYAEEENSQRNLEAGLLLSFQAFRYHDPELDFGVEFRVLPNLTDWGRVRIEFKTSIDYELFDNFYLTFHFFDNFDSRPPSYGNISKNDYGTDISITWKFK
ncbi:MAG: DUF481 domain-containing protein [Candidatus Aminicenantes bacterium]|nr:DUF481 domain-containing protein [Candidatus Aminicenantes bacterium]